MPASLIEASGVHGDPPSTMGATKPLIGTEGTFANTPLPPPPPPPPPPSLSLSRARAHIALSAIDATLANVKHNDDAVALASDLLLDAAVISPKSTKAKIIDIEKCLVNKETLGRRLDL
ncbi:hypothetical protein OPV22_001284 [Ensete ventricosum]|uniref:Uncharacterized protein n=1 Tax=Ensete ventricosum TaxID=4639 RepID=A0AAV8RVQ4_ENSVE|nr:hypothetical protein OPV22_001284 [Ensete ventricosum]